MLRSRMQRSAVGLVLVVAASWAAACSDKDSGEDTNNSGNESTDETDDGESNDTESQPVSSETEEETSSGDADSSEVNGTNGTSADDGLTDEQTTDEPPPGPAPEIPPEAIEAACARVEQCDQADAGAIAAATDAGSCTPGGDAGSCAESPAGSCSETLETSATLLGAVCPSAFGAYLQCVASMEGCDPEVECAEEGAALEVCEPESTPMLSEELVAMACANAAECNAETEAMCVQEITFGAAIVEAICPGAFIPYVTCLAEMTECDPDTECADETAALQACGVDPTM